MERNRGKPGGVDAALHQECLKRVDAIGIQVPVGAGAQQHPLRHVSPPEAHRIADDERVDAVASDMGRRRQSVRPGADHEQRDVRAVVIDHAEFARGSRLMLDGLERIRR